MSKHHSHTFNILASQPYCEIVFLLRSSLFQFMWKMAKAFGFKFGTLMAKNPFYQYLLYSCIHIFPLWNGVRVARQTGCNGSNVSFQLRGNQFINIFLKFTLISSNDIGTQFVGNTCPKKKMGEHILAIHTLNIRTYINTEKPARKGNGWILHNSRILRCSLSLSLFLSR